ncbi:hypothetical protein QCA50_012905 [Cerrena zonata]|uniref:Acetyl-coenzyme A transporter 1 n=1 Tax=Cerrena zonata TaxID=2478898 RepID=A0AAW0G0K3_9APHY
MSEDAKVHKRILSIDPTNSSTNELNYSHAAFEEENDGLLPISHQDLNEKQSKSTLKPAFNASVNSKPLPRKDYKAFAVLVILYLLQGVPVGLAFGSIPFILKSKLSYSQVGIFSLASYPYSLKLLWSPIVDAIYSPKWGRLIIDDLLEDPQSHLTTITACFFLLVFFCATQDIAVDGWALTCLSPEALSYASTAQTVGINSGYFSSFTIYLALSSPDFANKYIRSTPLDTGLFLMVFIPEDPPHLAKTNAAKLANEKAKVEDYHNTRKNYFNELKHVYYSMYQVLKLPNVQTFVVILLTAKFGFQVNEAATNLKLLEKGLSKEDLSITVLINFPFEMLFGYYAGRWSTGILILLWAKKRTAYLQSLPSSAWRVKQT